MSIFTNCQQTGRRMDSYSDYSADPTVVQDNSTDPTVVQNLVQTQGTC